MPRALTPTTALGAVGLVTAAAGVAVLASRASREASFGWFAYAPLAESQLDGLVAISRVRVVGAVLLALGLVLVPVAVGARIGRSGSRPTARRGVAVLGGLALVAGAVTAAVPRSLVVLGEDLPPISTSPVLLPVQLVGLGVALVGVLLLAGVAGVAGSRARARG